MRIDQLIVQRGMVPTRSAAQRLIEREFNLSWRDHLPEGNTVTDGRWFTAADQGQPVVSVEEGLAKTLGLKVGDELKLLVFGQEITAKIASFRDYAWRSGNVNFGFVFSPNAFKDFDVSYLGLTLETVSRTLSAFNEIGLISVDQRTIGIKDPEALKNLRRLPPSRTRAKQLAAAKVKSGETLAPAQLLATL